MLIMRANPFLVQFSNDAFHISEQFEVYKLESLSASVEYVRLVNLFKQLLHLFILFSVGVTPLKLVLSVLNAETYHLDQYVSN